MFGEKRWKKLWESGIDFATFKKSQKKDLFVPVNDNVKDFVPGKTYSWDQIGEMMKKVFPQTAVDNPSVALDDNGKPIEPQVVNSIPLSTPPLSTRLPDSKRVYICESKSEYFKIRSLWWTEQMSKVAVCNRCRRSRELTTDHIIPQQLLAQMGFEVERMWDVQNMQILCRYCNVFKSNKLDFSNPLTKILLYKYLNLIENLPDDR